MTEPEPQPVECDDEPKLTAEEWAYVDAFHAGVHVAELRIVDGSVKDAD